VKTITPEIVLDLWERMSYHYKSRIADKVDSEVMQTAARALSIMGILDPEKFMKQYTTTIGDIIYIPFELGVPKSDGSYSLISQVRICVHEHQHVVQWRRGGLQFALEYLSDSAKRAAYEADAMRCNMEVQWWYDGTLPNIPLSVQKLKDYNCAPEDILTTARSLEMVAKVVQRGGVSSEAGKVAIPFLDSLSNR